MNNSLERIIFLIKFNKGNHFDAKFFDKQQCFLDLPICGSICRFVSGLSIKN